MNHLRELLEKIALNAVEADPHMAEIPLWDSLQRLLKFGTQAQCFWLGNLERVAEVENLERVAEVEIASQILRLPFPVTWLEGYDYGNPPSLLGMLAVEGDDGRTIEIFGFKRHNRDWTFSWIFTVTDLLTPAAELACSAEVGSEPFMSAGFGSWTLVKFCLAISCRNVVREQHEQPVKLQKARAARGKAPLFSYWTLQLLEKPAATNAPQGGTHAGPRVHLRRGHARQYAPGKWTWVQAHAVGDPRAGMVHKDYEGPTQ